MRFKKTITIIHVALATCLLAVSQSLIASSLLDLEVAPIDGVYYDTSKPGVSLTLHRTSADRYFGIYTGYRTDGGQMWRIFVAEWTPSTPSQLRKNAAAGALRGQLIEAAGGQALGQPYSEPTLFPGKEGAIAITVFNGQKLAFSIFDTHFTMTSPRSDQTDASYGLLNGQPDYITIRMGIEDATDLRSFVQSIPLPLPYARLDTTVRYDVGFGQGSPIFDALACVGDAEVKANGELLLGLTYDPTDGEGAIELLSYDISTQQFQTLRPLGRALRSRDGVAIVGSSCQNHPFVGLIIPATDTLRWTLYDQ
jgi:hypothetical protein